MENIGYIIIDDSIVLEWISKNHKRRRRLPKNPKTKRTLWQTASRHGRHHQSPLYQNIRRPIKLENTLRTRNRKRLRNHKYRLSKDSIKQIPTRPNNNNLA